MDYKEKLKDPRWLARKREILIRDKYTCKLCGSRGNNGNELHVHHIGYINGHEPWEYIDDFLVTLCDRCHHAVHKKNVQLSLRRSAIRDVYICEETTDWYKRKDYDGAKLYIHQGTILASDEIGYIFVAAGFPYFCYTDFSGEDKLPFTELPKSIAIEALFAYNKETNSISTNEYIFMLDGTFGIHPRYATQEERDIIGAAICSMICFDDNGE